VKFQPDRLEGVNAISRQEPGRVWVRAERHEGAVLVPWRGPVQRWPVDRYEALTAAHFEAVLALEPEVVVFGSGARLRFAPPALLRALLERRIGVETMDTAAACRTFNVLAGEGRLVVAALLHDAPASQARAP
jgi:uncharacterized protein